MKGFIYLYFIATTSLLLSLTAVAASNVQATNITAKACDAADCQSVFREYKTLARYGHSDAMYTLAEFYIAGYGTDKNMRLATKWYRKAAKNGNPFAQYKAGLIYLQDGENQDIEKGMKYLRAAHREGVNASSHLLGLIYLEGQLKERDTEKAKQYLSIAYENGHQDTIDVLTQLSQVDINLPALQQNTKSHEAALSAPTNEMEVITVSAPSFEDVVAYHVTHLRQKTPDSVGSTGTRLKHRSCGQNISCNVETDRDRIQDFLMSSW